MEDITDADYMHAKRVCKNFEIKNLISWYATLLMADFFKNVFTKLSLRFCGISLSSKINMANSF